MWRLANYLYRAFRNVATHRCPQDIIVPYTTICNKDDEFNGEKKQEHSVPFKADIHHIIKENQISAEHLEKLQEWLHQISFQQCTYKPNVIKPVEPLQIKFVVKEVQQSSPSISLQKEDTLESLLQADESYVKTVKSLSQLNEETTSIVNNQLAIEALETDNFQLGIKTLQDSAKDGKNAAALYNLGVCYERGIGVEKDHAKACDYYRQASILGHVQAQYNLSILSNHIDTNEDEDEKIEQTITNKPFRFRFSLSKNYQKEPSQSWNDYPLNLTKTLSCLS